MAKIKSVEEFTKTNGKKSWKFTMDDNTVGYTTNEKPWEYKEGDEVSVKVENKGKYNLLTFTRLGGSAPTPASTPEKEASATPPMSSAKYTSQRSIKEWKAQAAIDAMGFMVDAVATGKIDWPMIEEKQRQACNILWNEIDEIFSKG